ncbi:2-C-methyl-D-erythritol 4-phosphate cytidylyltransferase [bacterium]|nr:2-C-methyl-D-erythritol 4-phosphate cytidylyltransferase [bacterium]MBU1984471.1 2-C-methyl-D-erythritol 4-phosphate cytidylyltransferase [bacterium]
MRFALLMPAAGSGVRLGAGTPKALLEMAGVPMFVWAVRSFVAFADCVEAVIAAPPDSVNAFQERVGKFFPKTNVQVVSGGSTRQQSVSLALRELRTDCEAVAIHDAARPLVSFELIQRVLDGLTDDVAAVVPGIPVADTLKRIGGRPPSIVATIDRQDLLAIQTPQVVRREIGVEAHRMAEETQFAATDDVALIEHFDLGETRVVEGDPRNFKITTQEDLDRARVLLERR